MRVPASRRGFLSGLTTLPLIGGSVALIGSPVRAAPPVTPGMLATYSCWLAYERRALHWASLNPRDTEMIPCVNPAMNFHFDMERFDRDRWGIEAQQRAPVVLAAVGCPLTDARAEDQWALTFRPKTLEGVR